MNKAATPNHAATNPAIALWLQLCRLVGRLAELGPFVPNYAYGNPARDAWIANNYFLDLSALALAALIFAHLAVIDAESLALASALILPFFFCGAAEFVPEALCPPASRSNSFCRVCICSRIATARLSCTTDSLANGLFVI
jgi:hypothetical protein